MNLLKTNPMLLLPLILLELALLAGALTDIIRRDRSTVKGGKKWPWVLAICIINILGPIIYLTLGRKED